MPIKVVKITRIVLACFALSVALAPPSFSQARCLWNGGDLMYEDPLPPPGSFSITAYNSPNSTSIDLTWSSSLKADTYYGWYNTSTGPLTKDCTVGNGTSTSIATNCSLTGLTPNTRYYLSVDGLVTCYQALGPQQPPPSTPTGFQEQSTTTASNSGLVNILTRPGVPTPLSANAIGTTQFTANWLAPAGGLDGTLSYTVQVATDNGFTTGLLTVTPVSSTSTTIGGLSSNTNYYYRVLATNNSGPSPYSGTYTTVLTLPGAPTPSPGSSIGQTQLTANWPAASGNGAITSYTVQLSPDNTFSSGSTQTISTLSALFTTLSSNTSYYYRVLATNGTGSSPYSIGYTTVLTLPDAPTSPSASAIGQAQFTANWSAPVGGAASYTAQVSPLSDFSASVLSATVSGLSTTISTLTPGTTYYYHVKANNVTGSSSYTSPSVSFITTPATPTANGPSSVTQTSFVASWSTSTGATKYYLDVSTDPGFASFLAGYNNLDVGNVVTYPITISAGLQPNTIYYYRVRAANVNGNVSPSSISNSALTVPSAPTATAASLGTIGQDHFTANWLAASGNGVLTYTVQTATDNAFTTGVQLIPAGTSTSTPITGLIPGTVYYYRVSAANTSGSSPYSTETPPISVLTSPVTPMGISTTTFSANQATVGWASIATATGYDVGYRIIGSGTWSTGCSRTSATTCTLTGLMSNTQYDVQVSAFNGTNSPFSSPATILSLPGTPTATAVSSATIGQTQFTANWSAPSGGSDGVLNYSVQLSSDSSFPGGSTQTIPGGTGANAVISSLSPGTIYYYRVSAINTSGSSPYSSENPSISILTSPATPVGISPAGFSANQVTITWPSVPTATKYDIQFKKSTEASWTDACTGTTATDCPVLGLLSATSYDFQVRAFNGTYSPYSAGLSRTTIPDVPTNLTNTATTTTAHLDWEAVTGADHYGLEVSIDDTFGDASLLVGYKPKVINGYVGQDLTGLTPGTAYYWRLSAGNSNGVSAYSDTQPFSTGPINGGPNPFDILLGTPSVPVSNDQISAAVAGYFYPLTATLFYRKIAEPTYSQATKVLSGPQTSQAQWTVDPSMLDEMGLEFYLTVQDKSGKSKRSPADVNTTYRIRQQNNFAINRTSFGASVKDYTMISSPYDLAGTIGAILEANPDLGTYDPKKWRFVHYQNNENVDYLDQGLSKSGFIRGKSYWLLTKKQVDLKFGSQISPDNYQGNEFVLQLDQGWNQIATPYPFDVDWSKILDFNSLTSVGQLKVFNPKTGGFKDTTRLEKYSGAFVHADKAVSLKIPLTSKIIPGGRMTKKGDDKFVEQGAWVMPITVEQNGIQNSLGALGMHPKAKAGKDEFDDLTVPRFLNYLEWNSYHPEYFTPKFTRDIVPTQDSFTWTFSLNSGESGRINISWDSQQLKRRGCELILHDLQANIITDMLSINAYSFHGDNRQFKIYYSSVGAAEATQVQLGVPNPNPSNGQITIPIAFTNDEQPSTDRLQILDLRGMIVKELYQTSKERGLRKIIWDGQTSDGRRVQPGLYFFRAETNSGSAPPQFYSGKLIMY
ncbi:MAG TPA: fibronectin type III domain-containing protein [Cyclobacteriaceae bacterium]|nr:fibronectin type III domain-containing protein [Cyclobacteriaceae bacterium]